jgi:hypothetical protein
MCRVSQAGLRTREPGRQSTWHLDLQPHSPIMRQLYLSLLCCVQDCCCRERPFGDFNEEYHDDGDHDHDGLMSMPSDTLVCHQVRRGGRKRSFVQTTSRTKQEGGFGASQ